MADLPDWFAAFQGLSVEATSFSYGLDAAKPAVPSVSQIYLATDTGILYVCFTVGVWRDLIQLTDIEHGIRTLANAHAHGDLSGVSADQHHARQHALSSGADHTGRITAAQLLDGTLNYVLTAQGAGNDPVYAVTQTLPAVYAAGDNLLASNDTETNGAGASYAKIIGIRIGFGGVLRIKFDLKCDAPLAIAYARIYKNGSPVGTEQTTTSKTYVTKSEDIAGWLPGDAIQLFLHADGTNSWLFKNFRISIDAPIPYGYWETGW